MDVEIEPPHVHHATGHRAIDLIVPIAALFMSFVSIGVAWHHGEVMQELVHQNERLVQANSLPHVQLTGGNVDGEGHSRIRMSLLNQGIGPADVRSVTVTVDGRRVANLRGMLDACCAGVSAQGITTATLPGMMIRPGQEVDYIDMRVTPANRAAALSLNAARTTDRIVTTICYCSVFDECWTRNSRDGAPPKPVARCEASVPQYRD